MNATFDIVPFTHENFGTIRAITENNEPWFVAGDVASALGYRMASDMTRRLDNDEKGTRSMRTLGGIQQMTVITEAGMYSAILGSQIPNAQAFKRWVTHEVLPSIRRHGGYMAGQESMSPEQMALASMRWLESKVAEQEARIEMMRPKAALGEAMEGSDDAMSVTEAHRHVSALHPWVKREWCFSRLRAAGMMCLASKAPTADGIRTGRLVAVSHPFIDRQGNKRISEQYSRVTPKGVRWLLAKAKEEEAAL